MGAKKLGLHDIEKILRVFNKIQEFPLWEFSVPEEYHETWRSILELAKEASVGLKIVAEELAEERSAANPPERKAKNKSKDKEFRDRIKKIYNYRCIKCGVYDKINPCTLHHIKKIVDGGKSELNNLTCLCRPCHNEWHANAEPKNIPFWDWIENV